MVDIHRSNTLETGDVEIGAVEIKNASDDTRAVVGAGNSAAVDSNALYVADANVKSDTATIAGDTTALTTGATPFFDSDGDNTAQALKAGAGTLYKLNVYNSNAAVAYVQLFDVAAGRTTNIAIKNTTIANKIFENGPAE